MMTPPPAATFRFGAFEFDTASGELRRQGRLVRLRPQPARLLSLLVGNPGTLLTRDDLCREIWAADTYIGFENGLNFCVNQIRRALGDSAIGPRFIETVPRRGYRFIAPVEVLTPAVHEAAPSPDSAVPPPRHGRPAWVAALGATILLPLGLFLFSASGERSAAAPSHAGRVRVAVLPFSAIGGEEEYLADGLTEEAIAQLSAIGADRLGVIARTSALQYRHTRKSVGDIARELGVDYIVEGSVRRDGSAVTVSVRLIKPLDQTQLWSNTYERPATAVFQVQRDVAIQIGAALSIVPPAGRSHGAAASAIDPRALDAYLKGLHELARLGPQSSARALALLREAARLSPDVPRVGVALAEALNRTGNAAEALTVADRAIARDATLAEAYGARARAHMQQWNWDGARADIDRALTLGPGVASLHELAASFLAMQGRPADAVTEIAAALALDPLSTTVVGDVGWYYMLAKKPDEAVRHCRRALALDPKASGAAACLFEASLQKGMTREAIEGRLAQLAQSGASPVQIAGARSVFDRAGLRGFFRSEADALGKQAEPPDFPLAIAFARAGENEQALARLERLYAQRSRTLGSLNTMPAFDSLRTDARYRDLLGRIGLPVPGTS